MMKILALFLLTIACSSTEPLVNKAQKTNPYEIKSIPVTSRLEARQYIQNQRNDLVHLFEHDRKRGRECLKASTIGAVEETKRSITLSSNLFLDDKGNTGFCFADQRASLGQHILLYCEGKKEVLDMKIRITEIIDLKDYKLCD